MKCLSGRVTGEGGSRVLVVEVGVVERILAAAVRILERLEHAVTAAIARWRASSGG